MTSTTNETKAAPIEQGRIVDTSAVDEFLVQFVVANGGMA